MKQKTEMLLAAILAFIVRGILVAWGIHIIITSGLILMDKIVIGALCMIAVPCDVLKKTREKYNK